MNLEQENTTFMAGPKNTEKFEYELEDSEMRDGGRVFTFSKPGKAARTDYAEELAIIEAQKTMRDPCIDATGISSPHYDGEKDRTYVTIKVIDD